MRLRSTFIFPLLLSLFGTGTLQTAEPAIQVIAHRGASGYLPEHTLAAKVLAFAQGADYLEQDLVLSRDGELLVTHDLTLDRTTDVAIRFPGRARDDGQYYVIDFTLEELRQLRVSEARLPVEQGGTALYPQRFPPGQSRFGLHTFAEELELIAGLQASTGRRVGIYPELKAPWFHHQEGQDLATAVLEVLRDYGYTSREQPVFLQSFDHRELRRVREKLLPALGMDLPLVQLIADNAWGEVQELDGQGNWQPADFDWMRTPAGLARLAEFVDGIGPNYPMLVTVDAAGKAEPNALAAEARALGLVLHPYTLRVDNLPPWAPSFEALLRLLCEGVGVDGVFTDFPDRVRDYLRNTAPEAGATN